MPNLDLWELQQLQQELKDWTFMGLHHIHKSWQFLNAQQALQWHRLARELSDRSGQDCCFYLGHVGSGRIETDIFNPVQGRLARGDLDVAVMMNAMEIHVKNPSQELSPHYLCESVRFLHPLKLCGDNSSGFESDPGVEHR
jgi:hypothetical protein